MTRHESERPLRVLHCPDIVGGHAPQLAKSERALGVESRSVSFHPSPYGYQVDEALFRPGEGAVWRELRRWRLLSVGRMSRQESFQNATRGSLSSSVRKTR